MKIAMMVRSYLTVPRPSDMIYAPIDLAQDIAEGLAKRGHQVDFFAPMGSKVKGVKVMTCNLRPLAENQDEFKDFITDTEKMTHYVPEMWDDYMIDEMFKRARRGDYDILHFHHPEAALPLARIYKDVPVVATIHDPVYSWYRELFELYQTPNFQFISISNNQRRMAPDLPYAETVFNGINLERYPYSPHPDDYLLYAGRIVPDKGVKEAIQVAKKSNHRLLIIGPVYRDTQWYFNQYIKPNLDDQILYLGFIEQKQLSKYYAKAKALLTPVQWEEPFGLTTIEAMSSGTPVISLNRGAAPEIIVDGRTGFVVESISEMIKAVGKVHELKRRDCHEHVKANFSVDRMVDGYEAVFEEVIDSRRLLSPRAVRQQLKKVPEKIGVISQKRRLRKIIERSKRLR